jgi:preprotein translocase subunit SecE
MGDGADSAGGVIGTVQFLPSGSIRKRSPANGLCETERHMASKTTNPFVFLQQVRQETSKVTWPSRRETTISTIMVLIFAVIAALFFFAADQILAFGVELLLSLGR